ncbi:MAG: HAMP domain-containing sensor histidine kinase [Bacteroidales bacterium]|nr:HAMP domain-containing sensor histidine kinase [Bacteroidales bacterium]
MINRALTLTSVAIFFLLALQGVWLFRLIDNEMNRFSAIAQTALEQSLRNELDWRLRSINKGKNFNLIIANNIPKHLKEPNNPVRNIDIKENQEVLTNISIEEALQEIYKKDFPLNLDTLASFFQKEMDSLGKGTSFQLTYLSPDTTRQTPLLNQERVFSLFHPTFDKEMPLTVSRDLVVKAHIYYPASVFKGDLLIILILSMAITIFILFSIVVQTRMLYKQVSLAKVKENITHFLTHELRSPLQSSITNLEVGEMATGENSAYFLSKAKEQLYFLNSLIENILNINKFEKRQSPLERVAFHPMEAIEPHIARHSLEKAKQCLIRANLVDDINEIFGDKLHITNATGNLIDNAVKYSGESVEITVTVKSEGKYNIISVKDNGIGIPKEEQSKVFEKFYRIGKKEYSQKGKGFGLGLTYVMWVVKAHKGKIELKSEVGKGSEFFMYFKKT